MMGQVKKEMTNAEVWWPAFSDRQAVSKMKKEELMARLRLVEGQVRMYEILEKTFGYCHPDVQVARMGKAEALKVHEKIERDEAERRYQELKNSPD